MRKEQKLIVALDSNKLNEVKSLALELKNCVGYLKLGLEFFLSFGVEGVNEIAKIGIPIFLDLKLHDIPNTVSKAALGLIEKVNEVEILTLHASGGKEMLKTTKQTLAQGAKSFNKKMPMIFGITILTSHKPEYDPWEGHRVLFPYAMVVLRAINRMEKLLLEDIEEKKKQEMIETIYRKLKNMVKIANNNLVYWVRLSDQEKLRIQEANKGLSEHKMFSHLGLQLICNAGSKEFFKANINSLSTLNDVINLTSISYEAAIDGVVCSALETKDVKQIFPHIRVINPGIRPSWYKEKDDQARVLTPKEACNAGADYIVVGRPITTHSNPKEAVRLILEEMI